MTRAESVGARVARTLWSHAPRLLVSLIIAGGFIWLFRRGGLPLVPARSAFSELQPWSLPVFAALTCAGMFFRTHRWLYLLRPIAPDISQRRVVGIGMVGIAAILFAPLRMGEAARPYLLARDGKVSFFQALGAAGAERVVDGLVLTLVSAVALAFSTPISPLPNHLGEMPLPVSAIPRAIYLACSIFVAAFVAMTVFYLARDFARRVTRSVLGVVSVNLARFVTTTLERLSDGLGFLSSRTNGLHFLGETLVYWGCTLLAQWVLLRGSGIACTFSESCVALGVLGLGAIVPAGPGFFGAYQIAIYSGLALFFPLSTLLTSGAAMVFISYAAQLLLNAGCCALGFWLLRGGPPLANEPGAARTSVDRRTDSGADA